MKSFNAHQLALSPSLTNHTASHKLCRGLGLVESTIFESFELGSCKLHRELIDLIASRSEDEIALVTRVVRALIDGFGAPRGESK